MWNVLPKNEHEQLSNVLIRGIEPARIVNESHIGTADILKQHVPSLMDAVLGDERAPNGFTLEDAVALIATMEQLIFDSESSAAWSRSRRHDPDIFFRRGT